MYEFLLPDIGEGISEAELISWSVQPGEHVKEDQELATISTDKVNVELPSPRAGIVKELCWEPGDIVKVGAVFIRIEPSAGEDQGVAGEASARTATQQSAAAPTAISSASENRHSAPGAGAITAAPSTRKLAQQLGIDLSTVAGSGPDGRILARDLDAVASANPPAKAASALQETARGMRSAMAERMAYSVHTLAHSTMSFEVPGDALLALHKHLSSAARADDVKISMSAMLSKCVAAALMRHGRFNATIDEDARALVLHGEVNLGLALATDQGLSVPVLRNVQEKTLLALAGEVNDLVARGRSGRLQPADYQHGTFTLSNTGSLEQAAILSTRPVINAPQSAILWVSKIKTRPRVVDERLEAGAMMNCSLSFDHRFIDGAESVAFINDLARFFEKPHEALHENSK